MQEITNTGKGECVQGSVWEWEVEVWKYTHRGIKTSGKIGETAQGYWTDTLYYIPPSFKHFHITNSNNNKATEIYLINFREPFTESDLLRTIFYAPDFILRRRYLYSNKMLTSPLQVLFPRNDGERGWRNSAPRFRALSHGRGRGTACPNGWRWV